MYFEILCNLITIEINCHINQRALTGTSSNKGLIVLFKICSSIFINKSPLRTNLNLLESAAKIPSHQRLSCNYTALDGQILHTAQYF